MCCVQCTSFDEITQSSTSCSVNGRRDGDRDDEDSDKGICHKNNAAQTLQKACRRRNAGRQIDFMRQCSQARADPKVAEAFKPSQVTGKALTALRAVFHRYTESFSSNYEFVRSLHTKGQMERKQFITMCSHAKMISEVSCSVSDFNQVFEKAIALALNPASSPQYKEDVFFGKRIGFSVFKDIAITIMTELTGLDTNTLINRLKAIPEKALASEKIPLEVEGSASIRSAACASSCRRAMNDDYDSDD
jgi:hypothetical protein